MKKILLLISGGIVTLIILNESGMLDALMGFLLVGAIPGTSYTIPSSLMLLFLLSGIWLVVFRLAAAGWLQSHTHKASSSTKKPKQQLPKRRYGQV